MTLNHWLLFISSALLYAAPLLWSSYCWPLVFVFAAPLLYVAVHSNISFRHGFAWGAITYGAQLIGVIAGLDNFAQGTVLARFAPALVLIATAALYSALWFACNKILINFFSVHTTTQKLIFWTISYGLFILAMEQYCFIFFGRLEGHFLFNPIFALAQQPHLLMLLPSVGKTILTLLMIGLSGALVHWYINKTAQSFIWVIVLTAPWIISLALPQPGITKPAWLDDIAYVPVKISSQPNLTGQALIAQKLFFDTTTHKPYAKLIIMPESSIFCDHLSKAPELCAHWSEQDLMRPMHIVLGSFRWDGPYYRNTLHWFYDGKLVDIFDKRHAMLLTEALPELFSFKLFKDLFFRTYPGITPSSNPRPQLDILEGVSFIPYICSELFFNDRPDDEYPKGSTILATANDIWCMNSNIPKMMCLAARFRAIQWQRNILYISYAHANYFDTAGNQINLKLGN